LPIPYGMDNKSMLSNYPSRAIRIIGAASGFGAPDRGCADGPEALHRAGLVTRLQSRGLKVTWDNTLYPNTRIDRTLPAQAVADLVRRLAKTISPVVSAGDLPLVLGGDHTCAVGTWTGLRHTLSGPLGLIWIDAHMDSHTPRTTPSGALHGMPLAHLLGQGDFDGVRAFETRAVVLPQHVCVIGVRSFEAEEAALLSRLGVRVYHMDEIRSRGLDAVFHEALEHVQRGTTGFGISIDVDALDPAEAPGTTTPVGGGLTTVELAHALAGIKGNPRLLAVEVAEYNPHRDRNWATAQAVGELLSALLTPVPAPIALEERYGAHNYEPLPVILVKGKGPYVWDATGNRYLDLLSGYSALSVGHCHPRLIQVLTEQARTLTLTSRAFYTDRLGPFLARLCELTEFDMALPMNTGAEAVETALKAARKWAYKVKHVPEGRAEIIACESNFHGRTLGAITMSTEPQYRDGFGPFLPGFKLIPFGDAGALEAAITENTAAFLVEPIQGEGGIRVPPEGYLAACASLCKKHDVLLIADEVQTGLGRTGRFLACEHEGVKPDAITLGKALGGGMVPISAFLARREVMQVFSPGDHGSTFGGNPLACAVGLEALNVLVEERLPERAAETGNYFMEGLKAIRNPLILEVRGKGLLIGVVLDPVRAPARSACEKLLSHGILTKEARGNVIRFAPALSISRVEVDWALGQIAAALAELLGGA
jgi:ornithine--oxo-acid transaminase